MRNHFYYVLFALLAVFLLCACSPPKVEDIGVIGGADGTTDIVIAESASPETAEDASPEVSVEPQDETA